MSSQTQAPPAPENAQAAQPATEAPAEPQVETQKPSSPDDDIVDGSYDELSPYNEKDYVQQVIDEVEAESNPQPETDKPEPETVTPEEPKSEDKPEEEPKSDAWEAAAAETKRARELQQKLRDRMGDLEAKSKEVDGIMASLRDDPVAFMDKYARPGWMKHVTDRIVDGKPGKDEEGAIATERERALLDRVERLEKTIEDRDNQREANEYFAQVEGIVNSGGDYEILKTDDELNERVFKVVSEHMQSTGNLLPAKDAVDMILAKDKARWAKLQGGPTPTPTPTPAPTPATEPRAQPQQQSSQQQPGSDLESMPPRGAPPIDDDMDFDKEPDTEADMLKAMQMIRWNPDR